MLGRELIEQPSQFLAAAIYDLLLLGSYVKPWWSLLLLTNLTNSNSLQTRKSINVDIYELTNKTLRRTVKWN